MANTVYTSSMALPSGAVVVRATQAGLCTATGQPNVFPGGGACTLWEFTVDNTANTATTAYFKLYDATAPATTADPDICIPVPGGVLMTVQILESLALATGCTFGVSTAGGSSAGTTMTNAVVVAITLST